MAPKTILLKGDPLQKQAKATAVAITPGMLLQLDATAGQIEAHATAGGNAGRLFAKEDSHQGKEIGTNYAVSAQVEYYDARPGDEIYALLADGENVVRGDFLESNGAGALRKVVNQLPTGSAAQIIQTNNIVGQALEALNLTGSANLSALGRLRTVIL